MNRREYRRRRRVRRLGEMSCSAESGSLLIMVLKHEQRIYQRKGVIREDLERYSFVIFLDPAPKRRSRWIQRRFGDKKLNVVSQKAIETSSLMHPPLRFHTIYTLSTQANAPLTPCSTSRVKALSCTRMQPFLQTRYDAQCQCGKQ